MYKNVLNQYTIPAIAFIIVCFSSLNAKAQLSFAGQLRTRGEFRDGYGTLQTSGYKDAAFISQRTRLTLEYKSSKVLFHTSVQDVRLWGQDASTITAADGNKLSLHEAWAEIILSNKKDTSFKISPVDYFAIKAGRQELVYDDERLLGNLDWTQQGRRHDAIVLKLLQNGWQLDLGAAFNQNSDAINYNGTFYTPANIPATVKDSKGNLVNTPANMIPLINSATHTTFNRSQRLAISMPTLKTGINQFLPNLGQIIHMRTKHIYTLPPCYFSIKAIFFCHLANHNQFIRSNFTSGNTRHYGIGTTLLYISQIPIITILNSILLHNHFVP